MPNAKIKLEKAIVGHEGYRELEFREPGYAEYMSLGEPFIWVPTGVPDQFRRVVDMPTIGKYAEKLLLDREGKPGDFLILEQLGVIDAIKIKDAIIDFFRAGEATDNSKTSQTN